MAYPKLAETRKELANCCISLASEMTYVHGYSPRESQRLQDQSVTLAELLHGGLTFAPGTRVLEAGCGVGAQTLSLATRHPGARIVAVERSAASLDLARRAVLERGVTNVEFVEADLFDYDPGEELFDHLFVCFVLEHVPEPVLLLQRLLRYIKPSGSVTVIEGDHGSAYFHPDNEPARRAIRCLVDLQAQSGGNALIGRELFPLMVGAGVRDVVVEPRVVYADAGHPEMVEGFTLSTFTAMIEGIEADVLESQRMTRAEWDEAIAALRRTAEKDGTFSYTFFRARGARA